MFDRQLYYEAPLLRLLCELPNGQGTVDEVCRLFEEKYKDHIPPEHYKNLNGKEPEWRNHVRWSRSYLRDRGFLDGSKRGIWQVTEAGRRWAAENLDEDRLPPQPQQGKSISQVPKRRSKVTQTPPGITLEMLEQTRQSMPIEQFRQVWGAIYDQLQAEERAKSITEINQSELGRRAKRRLDEIHAFLNGRTNTPPRSDIICDWIHFCYEFELHREAASLLKYVREDEVDSGYYRRAKKWAEASQVKLGW